MFHPFDDHGLPLVQLKEQRRTLVLALSGKDAISHQHLAQIAVIQQTIAAIETVIIDLDAETFDRMAAFAQGLVVARHLA